MSDTQRKASIGAGPWITLGCYVITAGLFLWGTVKLWPLNGPFLVAGGVVLLGVLEVLHAKQQLSGGQAGTARTSKLRATVIVVGITSITLVLAGAYMTWMR